MTKTCQSKRTHKEEDQVVEVLYYECEMSFAMSLDFYDKLSILNFISKLFSGLLNSGY